MELEGQRRTDHSHHLLHKLRHSRIVSQWTVFWSKRLRIPAIGYGRKLRQLSRAGQGVKDDGRLAPDVGCPLRARSAESCRNQEWKSCFYHGSVDNGRTLCVGSVVGS